MLKFKKKEFNSCFTKRKISKKKFTPDKYLLFSKNKAQLQIKIVVNILKGLKKRFKKRKIFFFIFINNNFIKSYKSINSRMGKGKGLVKKFCIRHESRILGSILMSRVARFSFLHKICYLIK